MTVYGRNMCAVMWPDCIYIYIYIYITVLIYCCVLTEYNTLYKLAFLYFAKHITLLPGPQNVSSHIIILVIKDSTLSERNPILLFEENRIFPFTWYCMQIIRTVVWCYNAVHLATLVQGLRLQGVCVGGGGDFKGKFHISAHSVRSLLFVCIDLRRSDIGTKKRGR